jgi:hypothetical protein
VNTDTGTHDNDDPEHSSDSAIDNATVSFRDGNSAHYSRVEFLPNGRLKTSLTTPITDNGKHIADVTDVAYYAAGGWLSVHPPQVGVLIADTTASPSSIRVDVIPKHLAAQCIKDWLSNRGAVTLPEGIEDAKLLGEEFTVYDRSGDMRNVREKEKVRFRWLTPAGHYARTGHTVFGNG